MADSILPEGAALSAEKLRAEIVREREQAETLMRQRLNWAAQEAFWQRQTSNWESQEKYWRWQIWALLSAFLLGAVGLILRVWP